MSEITSDPESGTHGFAAAHTVTDPKAMRALAHPLRLTLLEQLGIAGTLTATQAAERVGVTPAVASFHLRTLAKYGFAEEAGGGHGRERPWRQIRGPLSITEVHDDPDTALVAGTVNELRISRLLDQIRKHWMIQRDLPLEWRERSGCISTMSHLTVAEARQLQDEVMEVFLRHQHRTTDPAQRPDGSQPVQLIAFLMPLVSDTGTPKATAGET